MPSGMILILLMLSNENTFNMLQLIQSQKTTASTLNFNVFPNETGIESLTKVKSNNKVYIMIIEEINGVTTLCSIRKEDLHHGELVIPDSVTSIGNKAFNGCSSLTSVIIPSSVTSIGNQAFCDCIHLTHLIIPNSVASIGREAFSNCSKLTQMIIPDSVTFINNGTFAYCKNLTHVIIPDSITSIGQEAFSGCSSLTNITIPSSVTSIQNAAFTGCASLTHVVIPDSVTSLGGKVFSICNRLTDVVLPRLITRINSMTFYYCSNLTHVVIPDSVVSIDDSAFSNCSSLIHIAIPDSVRSIGSTAFSNCSSLTHMVIPDSVSYIGDSAFSGCSSLNQVVIPNSIRSLDALTFSHCSNLTHLVLPDSLTSINYRTFRACSNIRHIFIDTDKNTQYNAIKALLPRELREQVIDFHITSQILQHRKEILMDAALACHPLQSLPSSQHMNFLVRNVLDFHLGDSFEPIRLLKTKLEALPIACHTQEELEVYKQQLKQIHFDFQLQLTHHNLKAYLKVLEKQMPSRFFSSTPEAIEMPKGLAVFSLIARLIDFLENNSLLQVNEEERQLLLERPLLLSKIPKDIQHAMGIIQEQSHLKFK